MINRKYGSKKIIMRDCMRRLIADQKLEDGHNFTAVDGSVIHLVNGVVCYQYCFYDCNSLNMQSFFNSLLRSDTASNGISIFYNDSVRIDADLFTSHHGKINVYDYISSLDELVNQIIKWMDTTPNKLSQEFYDGWIVLNDLQCYLDDVTRTQSYNASQVVAHQIASALFDTIYEYAQCGIAVIEDAYWDITLPSMEAFVISFADHAGNIMRSTLYGDEYVI